MEDNEKIKQRFELLKMARELLNEDYINRRAEDHNKWVAENEDAWRTKRRNVPYPPFAQYPTDDEIVRAAANLYNFIYGAENKQADEIIPVESTTSSAKPIQEGDYVFPPSTQIPSVEATSGCVMSESEELTRLESRSFLPGWVRRSK